jgi:hypothetical protein
MAPVNTSLNNCALQIDWSAPGDGGSSITAYTIEILGSAKEFYPAEICGQNSEIDCLIPIADLKAEPWNLNGGDLVQVRSTAINANGRGAPSPVNTEGVRVVSEVPVVELPTLIRKTTRTITF